MKGQEDNEASRPEELWARYLSEGELPRREEEELAQAVAQDPALRELVLADQRIDGALAALARHSTDGAAFARQFVQRVAAERDGASFVSSVERRMRTEVVAGALERPRALRWLPLVLAPAALATAILVLMLPQSRSPEPSPRVAEQPPPAPPEHRSVRLRSTPPPAPPDRTVQLAEVGGVTYVVTEARRVPGARGSALAPGSGLVTVGPASRAVVAFADRTRLTLEGDSVLAQLAEPGGAVTKAAFLTRGRLLADLPTDPTGRPVLITTPHAEVSTLGARFAVFVDATSTRVDVEQGRVELARLGGGGPTVVGAAQYALIGERGDDALATPMSRGGAALLVAGTLALSAADERVKKRLESHGFEVHVVRGGPPRAEDLRRARLVVISSTASARDMSAHYRDLDLPIIVWEPYSFDDLGMTGGEPKIDEGVELGNGEILIQDPNHPLAAGRNGATAILESPDAARPRFRPRRMSYGAPGPAAQVVAVWPGMPARATVFAYERGAPMPGLSAAPGRRVGLFLHDRTAEAMSDAAWAIFDAAVAWCLRDAPPAR